MLIAGAQSLEIPIDNSLHQKARDKSTPPGGGVSIYQKGGVDLSPAHQNLLVTQNLTKGPKNLLDEYLQPRAKPSQR